MPARRPAPIGTGFLYLRKEKQRVGNVTRPIVHKDYSGPRITPNVYTTLDEIDIFADKVLIAINRGIA